jgi:Na+-driven multidrug efflux pump
MTMMAISAGAGSTIRLKQVARTGCAIGVCIGLAFAVMASFSKSWMGLFTSEPAIVLIGSQYLHWQAPIYPIFGAGIMAISASYAIGLVRLPLILNLMRLLLVAGAGWLAVSFFGTASSVFGVAAGLAGAYGITLMGSLFAQLRMRA